MKGIPSAVTWRLATFWGGTKGARAECCQKKRKKLCMMKGIKINLLSLQAHHNTLSSVQTLGGTACWITIKNDVKGVDEVFGGSDMEDR